VKQDSSAPKVEAEAQDIQIVPRRGLQVRESAWESLRDRVEPLTRDGRLAEVVLVTITFLLAILLISSLDHALLHPQFTAPPHLPVFMMQLGGG
jgi:hypothetical protein